MREMEKIKIGTYLIVTLLFSLTSSCIFDDPPIDWGNLPTAPCGVGSGNYGFFYDQYPDNAFACNTDARVLVRATPDIDNKYTGFHRAYLELSNFDTTLVSNWVNMTNSFNAQIFEIGGAIPAGEYDAYLRMINYQPGSNCPGSVKTSIKDYLTHITVTACNAPSKKMRIEYDRQYSDTSALAYYDVFQFEDTSALQFAFNAVDTEDSIVESDIYLSAEFVRLDSTDDYFDFKLYINSHKDNPNRMYLCGIKEFRDGANQLLDLAGFTRVTLDEFGLPEPPSLLTGSMVAVKSLLVRAKEYQQDLTQRFLGVTFKQLIEWAVIHELGHQRAVVGEEGHSSMFCVVQIDAIMDYGSSFYNLYSNPHFCETHMNLLKAVTW